MAKSSGIKSSIVTRAFVTSAMLGLVALVIVGKAFYLQYVVGEDLRKQAQERLVDYRELKATRGSIYSDNGSLLATSLPYYEVSYDPTVVSDEYFNEKIDSLCQLLSDEFKLKSAQDYKRLFSEYRQQKRRYIRLTNGPIDYQRRKRLMQWPIFRRGRLSGGVIFEKVDRRHRPFPMLARRTVGSLKADGTPYTGIEFSFSKYLAGRNGEGIFKKISGGNWILENNGTNREPQQGRDVVTTIDINLQDVAETALRKALRRNKANYGCVILMEVQTGHIKAISNLGLSSKGYAYSEKYNYAVADAVEPGSTFKLATYMALLESGKINPTDSVDCGDGVYDFGKDAVLQDHHLGPLGKITYAQAFARSSNVIARQANRYFKDNPNEFIKYLVDFGLTTPLGFQLKGSASPYLPTPSSPDWHNIALPWLSIGYGSKFSPLQILTLYNAVANKGIMIEPIIVTQVRNADRVVESFAPRVINKKIASDKTLQAITEMMVGVVDHGTASNIKTNIYKIAGKTGTAKKFENGKYINKYYTSFCGFFPAYNPRYSCIVAIDNPQGFMQHGSDVAAPVFKELADKIYARDLKIHRPIELTKKEQPGVFPLIQAGNFSDLSYLCNTLGISNHAYNISEKWVETNPIKNAIKWEARKVIKNRMPNCLGMTMRDALYIVENHKLKPRITGYGRVVSQWPRPNQTVYPEQEIILRFKKM